MPNPKTRRNLDAQETTPISAGPDRLNAGPVAFGARIQAFQQARFPSANCDEESVAEVEFGQFHVGGELGIEVQPFGNPSRHFHLKIYETARYHNLGVLPEPELFTDSSHAAHFLGRGIRSIVSSQSCRSTSKIPLGASE